MQSTQGSFGWGWSPLFEARVSTGNQGDVSVVNSGIQSLLPQPGYSGSYNLSNQQLLPTRSNSERSFTLQPDGTYKATSGDKGTLVQEGEHR
jgi:hypothetical protein